MPIKIIEKGFLQAAALLSDSMFLLDFDPNSSEDLKLYKLLRARQSNPDFELGLAEFICGEPGNNFPYRSSSYLTSFFRDLGYDFVHDGSTRRFWVQDVLLQLNIKDISIIIEKRLFNRRDFRNLTRDKKIPDFNKAVNEFREFIAESIQSDEGMDLAYLLDLNINTELLFQRTADTKDSDLNSLIEEAKNRFFIPGDKQIALEKLWDAFERLKTYFSTEKKDSAKELVGIVSKDFDYDVINKEFQELTDIGNSFRIRHHETDKKEITDVKHLNYLYFRMLSLIDLCLTCLNEVPEIE